ncbi:Ubiquitin-conjugating enzyme E2 1 [Tilletia horrida]|uniref:Ubiquitin-conjugating enzyme E2 1 n=1 Tax=Tilletia horrida TaxID=155126 RepID=A0AAN6JI19_9BASI|nr:Ubiquitin-conjugating enzyme E2 1 [Tilletia horrida]
MSDPRLRRINKEIRDIETDKNCSIDIAPVGENPFHLVGTFPGPENSPYEGGVFDVDIVVPEGYPFKPVVMKFITRVYHPNISSASGAICLDILKDQWSPVLTLKSTLLSLRSLLCSPEPNDPQDAEVAKVYLSDQAAFVRTAKYWTEIYANGSESARPPREGGKSGATAGAGAGAGANGSAAGGANGSAAVGGRAGANGDGAGPDPIMLAGLKREHVEQFENMGFSQDKVIEVLKKLNYRGANVRNVTDDTVLNELLSA